MIYIIFILLILYLLYTTEAFENTNFKYPIAQKHWSDSHAYQMNKIKLNAYYTFDGSFVANPKNTFIPRHIQDVKDIIHMAYQNNRQIRVSGSNHTFNDISITNDIIIKTFNFKNILNLDIQNKLIQVECGILLEELNMYLEENNLSLFVLPSIPYQTIAGCIATSTHGSNYKYGTMSSIVEDITIIQANGLQKTFYKSDPEFNALTTNLGCLGFVYSITLQCQPLFGLYHINEQMPWTNVLKNFNSLRINNEYLQIYIWPHKQDTINNCDVYKRRRCSLTEITEKTTKEDVSIKNIVEKKDVAHKILTRNQESGFYTEAEYALSLEHLVNVVEDTLKLFKDFKRFYSYTTTYPILIRFAKQDDSLLSLTSGRDSFFINIYNDGSLTNSRDVVNFFQEFEILMVNKYNGRPHYGKKNWLDAGKMYSLYSGLNAFRSIRNKLDPKRMFSNDYINRVIGL